MSSFMVCPETLYILSDYLFSLKKIREMLQLKVKGLKQKDALSIDREDLFNMLYEMNTDALTARYGKDSLEVMVGYKPEREVFTEARREYSKRYDNEELFVDSRVYYNLIFYKLGCYLYQCAEGNIDESPLYKYLNAERGRVAEILVQSSPEYMAIPIDEWV